MEKWMVSDPQFYSDRINPALAVSPWSGHRNFAYDLFAFVKPQRVVELGTHYGCSLFCFCQAVHDLGLNTSITAVDTWEGDPQAGYYDEQVWNMVRKTQSEFFSSLNLKLDRRLFQDAVKDVTDDSIDLIHIDGLHTYEAVSEDFHTWLPKLKENGIMLFHDTADYTGYGSHTFWEEIKVKYPSFEFHQSWGLGILFPKGDYWFKILFDKQNMDDKCQLYYFKAEYNLNKIKAADLEQMATERYHAMLDMEALIKEKDVALLAQAEMLENRLNAMNDMEKLIIERDKIIESQAKMLVERYDAMQNLEGMIKERDETIQAQQRLAEERYEAIQSMEQLIKERDQTILAQGKLLEERFAAIQNLESMIKEHDETIQAQQRLIEERYEAIQIMDQLIKERDQTILEQGKMLEERYSAMSEMEQMIKERDLTIELLRK
ncbi:class I SAM-dependent methyltransferase [Paenibacillus tarimensis]|uniref:class I SAM-dependent methyltransferase n=1 Tax=Paenibacillus tarimensis TaxID=416012 RepID=UPI001F238B4D|nr:class I SAM-dependent methyltransferase [Paenibacillus tarimensis]MCF2945890.1 class I SAM-dependent methyltransferase [Paenibacillus tarimensis]